MPKDVRERLGLEAHTEFEVVVESMDIRLQPVRKTTRQTRKVKGWPVLETTPGQVLTDADVRELRDTERR